MHGNNSTPSTKINARRSNLNAILRNAPLEDNPERMYRPVTVLDAALGYAKRGWPVFPVPPGTKRSYKSAAHSDGRNWGATTNPKEIVRDFRKWKDAGVGIVMGEKSGVWVVEADTPEGHDVDGIASLEALIAEHGGAWPKTRAAVSPTGSLHHYFKYPKGVKIGNSTSKIAKGVDVKGEGGMVVGVPTHRPGVGWYRWGNLDEVADAPQWLIDLCAEDEHEPIERNAFTDVSAYAPAEHEEIIAALAVIPNDDAEWDQYNRIGMACFDAFNGSDEGCDAFHMWAKKSKKYNAEDTDEKWRKYKGSPPKQLTVGTLFHLASEASPGWRAKLKQEVSKPGISATPFEWIEPSQIPQRQWLYRPHYIRKFLSMLVAHGGVGKTAKIIAELLAMVTGKSLLGVAPEGQLRAWYWNGEDPMDELQRRIAAARKHYGITKPDIGDRLFLDSGRTLPIVIAEDKKNSTTIAVPMIEGVTATLIENKIDVLIVDPFIACHRVGENNNNGIELVAKSWARITETANCSIMLVHHSRKMYGDNVSAESARGASALLAAVRAARTLNTMSEKEAGDMGVDEGDRRRYFRSDNGKANMALPTNKAEWFRLELVELGNSGFGTFGGDSVGVATAWEVPDPEVRTQESEQRAWQAVKDGGPWRDSSQSKKEPWVGAPIAEALGLSLRYTANKAIVYNYIDRGLKTGWLVRITKRQPDQRNEKEYIEASDAPPAPLEA